MASIRKNFIYASIYKVLELALPLITSPILSRRLGAESLGIYSYSYAIAALFTLVAELGSYRYGMREISKARLSNKKLNQTYSDIYFTHAVNGVIVTIVYFLMIPFFWGQHPLVYILQSLCIISNALDNSFLYVGVEEMKPLTIRDTCVKIATFVLIVAVIHKPNDLIAYIVIVNVCSIVCKFVALIYARKFVHFVFPNLLNCLNHYKHMIILMVPAVSENLYQNVGKLLIGVFGTKTSVGYYELSTKATIPKNIVSTLGTVMCPNIARLFSEGKKEDAIRKFKRSLQISMVASYFAAFGIASVAPEFAPWFWGEGFDVCAPLMTGLAFTIPVWTVGEVIRNQYLLPTGKDNQYMSAFLIGVFANIVGCSILIPFVGAMGAVLSMIFAELIMSIVQTFYIRKEVSIFHSLSATFPYLIFASIMMLATRAFSYIVSLPLTFKVLLEFTVAFFVFATLCLIYEKTLPNKKIILSAINLVK